MSILLWWGKTSASTIVAPPLAEPHSLWGIYRPPPSRFALENELAIIEATLHYWYS